MSEVCEVNWVQRFGKLFEGLGEMATEVGIELKADHQPYVQAVPRRVAAARREPLRVELERMESLGVIERIEEPTEWCSPCIVVPKPNGKIRVCIDFTKLNSAVKREYHPLPVIDETLGALRDARVFSKLDANSGYWQMKLRPEARRLTAFITPFGRFVCKRLPFGISSAPEIFQRKMQKVIGGLDGVLCHMDDILVYGGSQEEHDVRVQKVLTRLMEAGVTLNQAKCEFGLSEVKFVGHVVSGDGIRPDPEKTKAVAEFPVPTSRRDLRRFFGIVNYLGKFTPLLATKSAGLRKLLAKDADWVWSQELDDEFAELKRLLSSALSIVVFDISN